MINLPDWPHIRFNVFAWTMRAPSAGGFPPDAPRSAPRVNATTKKTRGAAPRRSASLRLRSNVWSAIHEHCSTTEGLGCSKNAQLTGAKVPDLNSTPAAPTHRPRQPSVAIASVPWNRRPFDVDPIRVADDPPQGIRVA